MRTSARELVTPSQEAVPHHSPFFHHEILANETYYSSCFLPTPPPNLRDASTEQTDTPELLIKLRGRRRGHGWFEYFMGCSAKPQLARINGQEVLTENIKLPLLRFYLCIFVYVRSCAHTLVTNEEKEKQRKRERSKERQESEGRGERGWKGWSGEISERKRGRVISRKDGGKDGRV